jgi:protein TonB
MLRLRTTVGLSVLALAIGIAGTAWLSSLTGDWRGPATATVTHVDKVRTVLRRRARPSPPLGEHAPMLATAQTSRSPRADVAPELPSLTPVDMPSLPASWFGRMERVSGRVVLKLTVDGGGRVVDAAVAQSSGSTQLDDRAMRTVRGWRFAVPADHPDGLSGSLVMRYDEQAGPVARTP